MKTKKKGQFFDGINGIKIKTKEKKQRAFLTGLTGLSG